MTDLLMVINSNKRLEWNALELQLAGRYPTPVWVGLVRILLALGRVRPGFLLPLLLLSDHLGPANVLSRSPISSPPYMG